MSREFPPIEQGWFLTGPTASGKTGVGLELAQRLGAEIVSLDSMAVYRRMDIGTAKPTPAERQRVPHHLVDCLEPAEEFSLADYVEQVHRTVADIRQRGREVLFVGGTPLYLKALLRGVCQGPPPDWPLREQLAEEARRQGSIRLHARLAAADPETAARLHPNDTRRIIRALEVLGQTGQPISSHQRHFDRLPESSARRVFVLSWQREQLHARINSRVEEMFAAGLVDEVRDLLDAGINFSRTARQALGYREVLEYLEGRRPLDETTELVKTRTRQFAKRQGTWFRSLAECRVIAMTDHDLPADVAARIIAEGRR